MTITRTRVGDVFSVDVNKHNKRYFQFIGRDETQLNSDVIRVFAERYPLRMNPDLRDVVSGEIDFHVHVVVARGVKERLWKKVGHLPVSNAAGALFRGSKDHGDPKIKVSKKWYVWEINEPFVYVGELKEQYRLADIGMVIRPAGVVHRMCTGDYDFVYPGF
jgi:hypothetical protein